MALQQASHIYDYTTLMVYLCLKTTATVISGFGSDWLDIQLSGLGRPTQLWLHALLLIDIL